MSREQFSLVIEEFCAMTGVSEVGAILQGSAVEVDGFSCYFEYRDDPVWARVLVYCDFGPLPSVRVDEVCRKLMEANLYLFATQEPTSLAHSMFLTSPDTGHVLLGENYPLKDLTSERLKEVVTTMAGIARHWNTEYFLPSQPGDTNERMQPFN